MKMEDRLSLTEIENRVEYILFCKKFNPDNVSYGRAVLEKLIEDYLRYTSKLKHIGAKKAKAVLKVIEAFKEKEV